MHRTHRPEPAQRLASRRRPPRPPRSAEGCAQSLPSARTPLSTSHGRNRSHPGRALPCLDGLGGMRRSNARRCAVAHSGNRRRFVPAAPSVAYVCFAIPYLLRPYAGGPSFSCPKRLRSDSASGGAATKQIAPPARAPAGRGPTDARHSRRARARSHHGHRAATVTPQSLQRLMFTE